MGLYHHRHTRILMFNKDNLTHLCCRPYIICSECLRTKVTLLSRELRLRDVAHLCHNNPTRHIRSILSTNHLLRRGGIRQIRNNTHNHNMHNHCNTILRTHRTDILRYTRLTKYSTSHTRKARRSHISTSNNGEVLQYRHIISTPPPLLQHLYRDHTAEPL